MRRPSAFLLLGAMALLMSADSIFASPCAEYNGTPPQNSAVPYTLNGVMGFCTLPANFFQNVPTLQILSITSTSLNAVPQISTLTNLRNLYLSNNDISAVASGAFNSQTRLTALGLNGNSLTEIPSGLFGALTRLNFLFLNDNQFQSFYQSTFSSLTKLLGMYLFNNQLTSLFSDMFAGLTTMKYLHMHGNHLQELPNGVFSGLSKLVELKLEANNLTSLETAVFSDLTSLTLLDLSDNEITSVPVNMLSGLSSLTTFAMANNPLQCDASLNCSCEAGLELSNDGSYIQCLPPTTTTPGPSTTSAAPQECTLVVDPNGDAVQGQAASIIMSLPNGDFKGDASYTPFSGQPVTQGGWQRGKLIYIPAFKNLACGYFPNVQTQEAWDVLVNNNNSSSANFQTGVTYAMRFKAARVFSSAYQSVLNVQLRGVISDQALTEVTVTPADFGDCAVLDVEVWGLVDTGSAVTGDKISVLVATVGTAGSSFAIGGISVQGFA